MNRHDKLTKILLRLGVIGPLLFIAIFLIEGFARVGYDPLRYPISSLAIGDFGWIQRANFFMVGLSIFAFAIGVWRTVRGSTLRSKWGSLLLGLAGIGLFGAGMFTSDAVFGYPASAPLALTQFTTHGYLHDLFSFMAFFGLPVVFFIFYRRFKAAGERRWAIYSIVSAPSMLIAFMLAGAGFKQISGLVNTAGAFQRLSISIGFAWIILLAIRLLLNVSQDYTGRSSNTKK